MSPSDDPVPEQPEFGWFYRFKCWLTGVDPVLLVNCPPRDHDSVNAIFLLQVGAWLWQAFIFAVVAHMMLAAPGQLKPELIAIAILLASIIALIDSFMIIRSSWYLHGLEELRQGGLVLPGTLAIKLKNAVFLTFRLLLAATLVQLVAAFVAIMLFGKDADRAIDAEFHGRNATIFAAAEERYDRDTASLTDERIKLAASVSQTDSDASALHRETAILPPPDEEVRDLRKHRARLENEKQSVDAAVSRARHAARQRDETASSRLEMTAGRAATIARDLSATRQRLQEAEARVERAAQGHNDRLDKGLGQIAADHREQVARLAALDVRLAQRAAEREATIRAAVERDPALQPRDDGVLARVHILAHLAEDPHNLLIILLIDAAFFAIELAAVLAKVTTFVPATYATELAKTEYLRAVETSRHMAEHINAIGRAPSTAPTLFEVEPLDVDNETNAGEAALSNGETGELGQSLRQAARTAHARAAKRTAPSKAPDTPAGENQDTAARRPRGRPPGSRHLPPPPPVDGFDFGEGAPPHPDERPD